MRARREQLGWSQSRLARASGVSRTVVNEVENGRRSPSLPTYDKLRRALGLDLASSLALLPTAPPAAASEGFLATVAALLITTGRVELADAAAALQVDATAIRTAVAQLAERLAAVGVAAVNDGVTIELTVLAHAAPSVERIRALEAVPTLSSVAVMTLVIVGHLGEATRRDVDERRGADSASVLDRLAARGCPTHRPGRYRTTPRLPAHHPRPDPGRPQHPRVLPSLVPPADDPHRPARAPARSSTQRLRPGRRPRAVATRYVSFMAGGGCAARAAAARAGPVSLPATDRQRLGAGARAGPGESVELQAW